MKHTDLELIYAATARCRCGAGLAYPKDRRHGSWDCSRVLKGEATSESDVGAHDSFPWAFYKVREETSVNNTGAHTTRPQGTIARTICKAKCPKCKHEWQSEPYNAAAEHRHHHTGPCPQCGYAVGANGSWSSREGEPIQARYPDVMIVDDKAP